jgi:hypothetical protein
MKVEQVKNERKEATAERNVRQTVVCLQKQITQDAQCCPAGTQFEAILDAYARDPERWDGLD